GSDRARKDVEPRAFLLGRREAVGGGQHVVGVKRRRVTRGASLPKEDLTAAPGRLVRRVRVARGPERAEVKREREELFVAVAVEARRVGERVEQLQVAEAV